MFRDLKIIVSLVEGREPVVAIVMLVIDGFLGIRSIRIIRRNNDLAVEMPYYRCGNGIKNYIYCLDVQKQGWLENKILEAYRQEQERENEEEKGRVLKKRNSSS